MLKRKWYWPLGLALLVHLAILGVITTTLSYPQQSEPEYMEVTLAELFSPPEPVNSTDSPQQPSTAADTNKFASNRSVANQSSPQPMIGSGAAATNGDTAVNAPVNMGNGPGNMGNRPGDTIAGSSTGQGFTESTPGPAGSSKPPGATRAPRVVSSEEPDYPDVARLNGWRGTVKLRVLVSEQGVVEDVKVIASSGYSQLDQAALTSMRSWQFSPALKEGRLVAASVVIPVTFQLK